jgi:hypothetical protein
VTPETTWDAGDPSFDSGDWSIDGGEVCTGVAATAQSETCGAAAGSELAGSLGRGGGTHAWPYYGRPILHLPKKPAPVFVEDETPDEIFAKGDTAQGSAQTRAVGSIGIDGKAATGANQITEGYGDQDNRINRNRERALMLLAALERLVA